MSARAALSRAQRAVSVAGAVALRGHAARPLRADLHVERLAPGGSPPQAASSLVLASVLALLARQGARKRTSANGSGSRSKANVTA